MAIRNIRLDDDPVLRKISREVDKFDDRLKLLAVDMIDTMYHANGVGLAAPQIGIRRRVIVVDISEERDNPIVMVNPEIIDQCGCELGLEGCLSVKNRQGDVERPTSISVKYKDINGNNKQIEADDFFARAICHEIDHLNGILYTDIAKEVYQVEEDQGEENEI